MEFDYLRLSVLILIPLIVINFAFVLNKWNAPAWVIRKFFHTAGIALAGTYGGFGVELVEIYVVIGFIAAFAIILSFVPSIKYIQTYVTLGTREGESRVESFFNALFTVISNVGVLILFDEHRWIYMAASLVVAFGDGLGEFVGKPFGKHKYKIISPKSIEGSLAVFLGSLIGIFIPLLIFGAYDTSFLWLYFLVALLAMIIEAFSFSMLDNILMPFATAFLLLISV
ncbi:MAG: hypothetical protein INQ03_08535 [Candidatus Heimdallarchaeota archaeon]|nr:hypothetical protein [Candidatus Heimdallarchaeota archaeon]